jgi:hypothetical protein
MTKAITNTTTAALAAASLLFLGASLSAPRHSVAAGAVRGQEIQPGQSQEKPMTREEAEALVNVGNENQVGENTQVEGKPEVADEQGAMPQGVGYANNPGELYDPAVGRHTYVHHYIHHIYHDGSAASAEADDNAPPPSGYVRGSYVVPDNENPNDRRSGRGLIGAYNLPVQHTYHGNVTHNYYGGYRNDNQGSGVPSGFFGNQSNTSAGTTWGKFGAWHPDAFDGAGSIGGFTD